MTSAVYPFQPVPFTRVRIQDAFWSPRIETNRNVTIPYDFQKCEETGRIDNFVKAAGHMEGPHIGLHFNDSDVYKIIEGAAYSLQVHPDPDLEAYIDDVIEPRETRPRLINGLEMLSNKRDSNPAKKHGCIPL